ncbi:MAG: sulfurtransferase TusA family protein [Desulfovibrio sp.]|jgi:TusA-related sulfurtransferase|nr:sulfurtransferase TusA family protein [Desulfovibrio sp.]
MQTIDVRGLSCPQPVFLVLEAIKAGKDSTLEVRVDNIAAVENITRAAASSGWSVSAAESGEETFLTLAKQ